MKTSNGHWAWKLLAVLGLLVVMSELVLRIASWWLRREYELDHLVIAVGALLGFWGCYNLNPKGTKEGMDIIKDLVPRFGRRSTDPVAIPATKTEVIPIPPEHPDGH